MLFESARRKAKADHDLLRRCADFVIAHDNQECKSEEEIVAGFQLLLDAGLFMDLHGFYGRMALGMLGRGLIHLPAGSSEECHRRVASHHAVF